MAWMAQASVAAPGSPPTRESLLFHTLSLPHRLRPPVHFPPTFLRGLPTQTSMRRGHGLDGNLGHGREESPTVKRARPASLSSRLHVLCPRELAPSEGTSPPIVVSRSPTLRPRQGLLAFEPVAQRRCEMGAFGSSEARSCEWGRRRARSSEPSGGFGRRAHGADPARPRVCSGLTFEACAADSGQTGKAGSPSGEGSSREESRCLSGHR